MNFIECRHALTTCLFIAVTAAAQTPDPIEGKWLGQVGFPQDRVELGLEFKRTEKNELKVYLYSPVINFYGLDCGVVERKDDAYEAKELQMSAALREGKLEGTYFALKAPMTLTRTETLPAEVSLPELPAGPSPKWVVKLGGAIHAPAALHNGVAYVGNTGGVFYALKIADGAITWRFNAGRPIFGEALATEEAVYFVCENGFLFKLDRLTGREQWRYDLGDARATRILPHPNTPEFDWDYAAPKPVLADGVLFVGAGDGGFHAVKAANGKRLWRFATKDRVRNRAAIDGANVIVGGWDGFVRALERKSGREVWKKYTHISVTSAPLVAGERIYIGNRGGLLAPLDHTNGTPIWRLLFWGSAVESDPVLADDVLYIGSSDLRRVSAIDPRDGRLLWRTDVFGMPWGRVAISGDRVYAAAAGSVAGEIRHLGSLCALERATGKVMWRWPAPDCINSLMNGFIAGPAIAGRDLIIGGVDGALYCFELPNE